MSRHPRRREAASMVEDNTNTGIHFDEARLCCLQVPPGMWLEFARPDLQRREAI